MTNKDETPATQPLEWQSLRLDSGDNFGSGQTHMLSDGQGSGPEQE